MVGHLFSIVTIFILSRLGLNVYEAIQVNIQDLNATFNLLNDILKEQKCMVQAQNVTYIKILET